MFFGEFMIPIFGILLVMIPVTGVTVSLVARSLSKVRRESLEMEHGGDLAARVVQLQEEVESLSAEVKELKAAQEFDRKLLGRAAERGDRA
jgi:hypothetical protein